MYIVDYTKSNISYLVEFFLHCTKSNISYLVEFLFTNRPSIDHCHSIEKVTRYLKKEHEFRIALSKVSHP